MPRGNSKKLFYSLLILMLWLGFVVDGSHALLADSVTLTGNTIITGSADLQISNSQSSSSTTYADSRPGFPMILVPGQGDDHYIFLKNVTGTAVPLSIDVATILQDGDATLPQAVDITFIPVDGTGTPNGKPAVSNLSLLSTQHLGLGLSIDPGQIQRIKVHTVLNPEYTISGKNSSYDLVFTGTQNLVR
jgi:hypothetical protein